MSEPRRLLEDGGSDLSLTLLRSARADGPPPTSHRKTLVALGLAGSVGAAVTTTSAASTATTALVKSAGTLALLKWVGVGLVSGAVTLGIVNVVAPVGDGGLTRSSGALPPPKPPGLTVRSADPSTRVAPAPSPPPAETAAPEPSPAPSSEPAPAAPAAPAAVTMGTSPPSPAKPAPSSLTEEVAALDGAREALAGGNAGRALHALDDHDRRFPGGALAPEATVLRIEALAQRGDRAAATRLGTAFLAAHPRSPHAARLRTLLGLSEPATGPAPTPAP